MQFKGSAPIFPRGAPPRARLRLAAPAARGQADWRSRLPRDAHALNCCRVWLLHVWMGWIERVALGARVLAASSFTQPLMALAKTSQGIRSWIAPMLRDISVTMAMMVSQGSFGFLRRFRRRKTKSCKRLNTSIHSSRMAWMAFGVWR